MMFILLIKKEIGIGLQVMLEWMVKRDTAMSLHKMQNKSEEEFLTKF